MSGRASTQNLQKRVLTWLQGCALGPGLIVQQARGDQVQLIVAGKLFVDRKQLRMRDQTLQRRPSEEPRACAAVLGGLRIDLACGSNLLGGEDCPQVKLAAIRCRLRPDGTHDQTGKVLASHESVGVHQEAHLCCHRCGRT